MLGRWAKRLVDQVSDVPSIVFFHNLLQNSLQKFFQFIFSFFYNFTKTKIMSRLKWPKSIRNYEKKWYLEPQTLGRWVVWPIVPATQRIILKIDWFLFCPILHLEADAKRGISFGTIHLRRQHVLGGEGCPHVPMVGR